MSKSLIQIWAESPQQSDKNSVHSYLPVYEEILAPYRETAKNVLEIGLFNGFSLLMWEKYFAGTVYGIDCSDQPHGGLADLRPLIQEGTHNIIIGDATSEADVNKHFGDIKFSVVIDDGSHSVESQLKTIELFKDRMETGGLIVIEDVQDIDAHRHLFEAIDPEKKVTIVDNRQIKGRYDDVLIIITDK